MTFVIATGGIDLAVGSVMAAAAIIGGHYFASAGSAAFMLATVRGEAEPPRYRYCPSVCVILAGYNEGERCCCCATTAD